MWCTPNPARLKAYFYGHFSSTTLRSFRELYGSETYRVRGPKKAWRKSPNLPHSSLVRFSESNEDPPSPRLQSSCPHLPTLHSLLRPQPPPGSRRPGLRGCDDNHKVVARLPRTGRRPARPGSRALLRLPPPPSRRPVGATRRRGEAAGPGRAAPPTDLQLHLPDTDPSGVRGTDRAPAPADRRPGPPHSRPRPRPLERPSLALPFAGGAGKLTGVAGSRVSALLRREVTSPGRRLGASGSASAPAGHPLAPRPPLAPSAHEASPRAPRHRGSTWVSGSVAGAGRRQRTRRVSSLKLVGGAAGEEPRSSPLRFTLSGAWGRDREGRRAWWYWVKLFPGRIPESRLQFLFHADRARPRPRGPRGNPTGPRPGTKQTRSATPSGKRTSPRQLRRARRDGQGQRRSGARTPRPRARGRTETRARHPVLITDRHPRARGPQGAAVGKADAPRAPGKPLTSCAGGPSPARTHR